MGCISSKLICSADLDLEGEKRNPEVSCPVHVVSLKSTTLGVLNLDPDPKQNREEEGGGKEEEKEEKEETEVKVTVREWKKAAPPPPPALVLPQQQQRKKDDVATAEVIKINAWEIMQGLEGEDAPVWSPLKKPNKFLANLWSPKARTRTNPRSRKASSKENSPLHRSSPSFDIDSKRVLRPFSSVQNSYSKLGASSPNSPALPKQLNQGGGDGPVSSSSRRSLSPLFDPQLIASIERELSQHQHQHQEKEQIKKVVASTPKTRESDRLLQTFQENCPPGGEGSLVLYTTTLRGIRKTFEECNAVRSVIESHGFLILERDVSMDSGYREELRVLLKEVKVPVLFVKGRLIGGAGEVLRLEEEGKLGLLLKGIPKAKKWCEGCAGVRFVMCKQCNGSCKVLDQEQKKKMVKCGDCNENGLIRCPMCC